MWVESRPVLAVSLRVGLLVSVNVLPSLGVAVRINKVLMIVKPNSGVPCTVTIMGIGLD